MPWKQTKLISFDESNSKIKFQTETGWCNLHFNRCIRLIFNNQSVIQKEIILIQFLVRENTIKTGCARKCITITEQWIMRSSCIVFLTICTPCCLLLVPTKPSCGVYWWDLSFCLFEPRIEPGLERPADTDTNICSSDGQKI